MSKRYPGGLITKTPVVPTTSAASGVWTLDQAITYIQAGTWPTQQFYWIGIVGAASSTNLGQGVAVDSTNNVYFMGYGNAFNPASNYAVETLKFNASGVVQLQKKLGGASQETGHSCAVDSSNNLYITGTTNTNATPYIITAKYNSAGTLQWQSTYGSAATNSASYGIAVDSSGNSHIIGTNDAVGTPDVFVIKIPTNGVGSSWTTRIANYSYNDGGWGIAVDSSSNVYIAMSSDTASGGRYFVVAKFNSSGTIQWQRQIGDGSFIYNARGITVDSSGNSYVCGYAQPSGSVPNGILVVKYDTSGAIQWQRRLSYSSVFDNSYGYSIALDSSGNVYVTGTGVSGTNNVVIAKYNNSGTIQWQRTLSTTATDQGYGIRIDSLGNLYIIGYTNIISGASYFLFAKLPSDGSLTGTYTVGGQSFVYAASSLTDSTPTYNENAGGLSVGSAGLSQATATLLDASMSLTPSVTTL